MITLDNQQGSPEWLADRLGKPSASNFGKLITGAGKPSSSAEKYIDLLVAERLTGKSEPFYVNDHMARGNELEPEAREAYEFISGNAVTEHGFILDDSEEFGCSPDGLVEGGGLEIKCAAQSTHAGYMRDPQIAVKKYYQQIQGCMWVCQREWWDLFLYHPELPHVLVRVERNNDFIEAMAVEVKAAVNVILNQVEKHQ